MKRLLLISVVTLLAGLSSCKKGETPEPSNNIRYIVECLNCDSVGEGIDGGEYRAWNNWAYENYTLSGDKGSKKVIKDVAAKTNAVDAYIRVACANKIKSNDISIKILVNGDTVVNNTYENIPNTVRVEAKYFRP